MLKSIIIDDERSAIGALENLLNEIPGIEMVAYSTKPKEGLSLIIEHQPDVLFLDIEMPQKDGFFVLDQLKSLETKKPKVVFVTGHDQAIKAFEYGAFDYLLKPIHPDRLLQTINKIKSGEYNKVSDSNKLCFSTGSGMVWINPDTILGCLAEGNYTDVLLSSGKQMTIIEQLGKLHKRLPKQFIRSHRSALVNKGYLIEFQSKKMFLILGHEGVNRTFPVSRSGLIELKGSSRF
ncbi:MAG: response regulator transcription factor [Bacteroidetes bacterium]|jgi:two-component system, LytTR family, response regulator|nr:response regulator transcription factor [Bacteroidota bacterium]MBT4409150.1 response regulator transcription factor [Bacteroidota bacterium]